MQLDIHTYLVVFPSNCVGHLNVNLLHRKPANAFCPIQNLTNCNFQMHCLFLDFSLIEIQLWLRGPSRAAAACFFWRNRRSTQLKERRSDSDFKFLSLLRFFIVKCLCFINAVKLKARCARNLDQKRKRKNRSDRRFPIALHACSTLCPQCTNHSDRKSLFLAAL